jgi:hypothetical protein
MRIRVKTIFVAMVSSVFCASPNLRRTPPAPFAQGTYCLPDTDMSGQWLIGSAMISRHFLMPDSVGSRDSATVRTASSASVAAVNDEAKCARAARALDSVHVGVSGSPVHLVTMGTHYLVFRSGTNVEVHLDSVFTAHEILVGQ